MLPLAVGLPVMLVDHLDRNPSKQLLRGKEGHIHSWVQDPDERSVSDSNADERLLSHVPLCVFVDFHTEAWSIPGAPGPGIYPVLQTERTWFLDGYRGKKAVLGIRRKQIPLAPGLASTSHGAQGKTKTAIIADLVLGRGVSSIASYVAITRVRSREGLMIYRPFELEMFTQGIPQGTALLLRKLRGESLDWNGIEEKLIWKQTCAICETRADKSKFQAFEFRKKEGPKVCLECMEDCKGEFDDWTHHFCETCQSIKPAKKFAITVRQRHFFRKPHCTDCFTEARGGKQREQCKKNQLQCSGCKVDFEYDPIGHITEKQRKHHLSNRKALLLCYKCHDQRPTYTCSRCGDAGQREDFQKTNFEQDCKRGTQQCLKCKSGKRQGKVCMVEKCTQFIALENLSRTHKNKPSRPLVCDTCAGKGYSTRDTHTYVCCKCKNVSGGHGIFQSTNFQRAAKRGTQKCKSCFN